MTMEMNELQYKRVFTDPLFLYDQFIKAHSKYYSEEEFDTGNNLFASCLLVEHKELFGITLHSFTSKESLEIINTFFRGFYKLLTYVKTYAKTNKLEWDIYPSFSTINSSRFRLSLNFLIKLRNFDLIGNRNQKVWSYKDPYMIIPVAFTRSGAYVENHDISVFFGKTNLLGFTENFSHPHIRNRLVDYVFNSTDEINFGQAVNDSATNGNFCYGQSNLQNSDLLCDNQDEFNFFMLRFINYIKEYNSSDCFKKVPTGLSIPPKTSVISLVGDNQGLISDIVKSGFNLKPNYFYFIEQLEIVDYFYKDLIQFYLDNETNTTERFKSFMLNNLTDGNNTLISLLSLTNEEDIYSTILEENKSFPFIFNGKEAMLELYYEKNNVTFEYEDLHLSEDAKNFLKNQLIIFINGKY